MIQHISGRVAAVSAAVGTLMTLGFILAGPASATPADPVQAAFDDMESKVTLYGAAIVALVVLAVGIFLGIKYLRKGVSKA
jgi:hypothetical protein